MAEAAKRYYDGESSMEPQNSKNGATNMFDIKVSTFRGSLKGARSRTEIYLERIYQLTNEKKIGLVKHFLNLASMALWPKLQLGTFISFLIAAIQKFRWTTRLALVQQTSLKAIRKLRHRIPCLLESKKLENCKEEVIGRCSQKFQIVWSSIIWSTPMSIIWKKRGKKL